MSHSVNFCKKGGGEKKKKKKNCQHNNHKKKLMHNIDTLLIPSKQNELMVEPIHNISVT